jgi:hypothetical protein
MPLIVSPAAVADHAANFGPSLILR